MKIALKSVVTGQIVSMWDSPHTLIANRSAVGPGETFEVIIVEPDPPPPPPPPPPPDSWDCPRGLDLSNIQVREQFIVDDRVKAFGPAYLESTIAGPWQDDVAYWANDEMFDGLMQRGRELGYDPPEIYPHQRIIGRLSGPPWVARFGPYAGLVNDNESRTN